MHLPKDEVSGIKLFKKATFLLFDPLFQLTDGEGRQDINRKRVFVFFDEAPKGVPRHFRWEVWLGKGER